MFVIYHDFVNFDCSHNCWLCWCYCSFQHSLDAVHDLGFNPAVLLAVAKAVTNPFCLTEAYSRVQQLISTLALRLLDVPVAHALALKQSE